MIKRKPTEYNQVLNPTEGRLAHHILPDNGLRRAMRFTRIGEAGANVLSQFTDSKGLMPPNKLRLIYNR